MADVYKTEIERALDEKISNENGVGFQFLAVVLARRRWPDLIACEPKKDLGTDAYAPSFLSAEGEGKVLACSITATLAKIRSDATKIRDHFEGVKTLIFATPKPVTPQTWQKWANTIRTDFGYELVVMSRADIVTSLLEPSNAPLCRTQLGLGVSLDPDDADNYEKRIRVW